MAPFLQHDLIVESLTVVIILRRFGTTWILYGGRIWAMQGFRCTFDVRDEVTVAFSFPSVTVQLDTFGCRFNTF